MENALPAIPPKRYFTIGEVSELCGVKPYVLRYWEQEFSQLRPMKRRGNRRYYQHHEVLLIRRIRDLLYEQGFTISGARNRLSEVGTAAFSDSGFSDDLTVDLFDEVAASPSNNSIAFGTTAQDVATPSGLHALSTPVLPQVALDERDEPSGPVPHDSKATSPAADVRPGTAATPPPLSPQAIRHELQSIKELLDAGAERDFLGILAVSVGV
ncbi:MAG: hypothetical protein RIQ60_4257 [Pseudomonadota bacterium]|jgi:DNA-binding transcriptional MerR regulator